MELRTTSSPPVPVGSAQPSYSAIQAWSITSLIVVFATINWADKAIIGIVARSLQEDLGLTATQIGFAGSAFFFLFSISGAAVGFLGDRFQVRWILFVLATLWGLIQFPIIITGTFTVLLVTRIILGAAEGPATAMANTAAFQWFPPGKRSFPSALVTSGSSFAKIAAAPMLALVLAAWDWRACFVIMGIASFVWCALWLVFGKEGPYAARGVAGKSDDTGTDASKAARMVRVPLRDILLTRSFIGALVGTFTVYGLVSASITWIPSYFEAGLGYSRLNSGMMFGLPSIASLIMMFGSTFIADRLSSRRRTARTTRALTTAAFLVVGGIALAALPFIEAPVVIVALLIFGYGCASVALPMMNAVISQITPAHQLASTLGIFLAVQNLAGLITPVLVGILVDHAPTPLAGYSFAYQIFGLSLLFGGLVIAALVHPERDAARIQAQLANRQILGFQQRLPKELEVAGPAAS